MKVHLSAIESGQLKKKTKIKIFFQLWKHFGENHFELMVFIELE